MNKIILISSAIYFCLHTACSPIYYKPNTQLVPMMTEKNEFAGQLSANAEQFDMAGAYSVTDHVAVMTQASFYFPIKDAGTGSGKLLEIGAGYFTPVFNNNFIFETYGIVGYGNLYNTFENTISQYPGTTGQLRSNVMRFAVQPSLSYNNKYFGVGLSTRIGYVNYHNVRGSFIFNDENQIDYLKNNNNNLILDPALTLKAGYKNVKIQLQMGLSYNASNPKFRQHTSYMTGGLYFNIFSRKN